MSPSVGIGPDVGLSVFLWRQLAAIAGHHEEQGCQIWDDLGGIEVAG